MKPLFQQFQGRSEPDSYLQLLFFALIKQKISPFWGSKEHSLLSGPTFIHQKNKKQKLEHSKPPNKSMLFLSMLLETTNFQSFPEDICFSPSHFNLKKLTKKLLLLFFLSCLLPPRPPSLLSGFAPLAHLLTARHLCLPTSQAFVPFCSFVAALPSCECRRKEESCVRVEPAINLSTRNETPHSLQSWIDIQWIRECQRSRPYLDEHGVRFALELLPSFLEKRNIISPLYLSNICVYNRRTGAQTARRPVTRNADSRRKKAVAVGNFVQNQTGPGRISPPTLEPISKPHSRSSIGDRSQTAPAAGFGDNVFSMSHTSTAPSLSRVNSNLAEDGTSPILLQSKSWVLDQHGQASALLQRSLSMARTPKESSLVTGVKEIMDSIIKHHVTLSGKYETELLKMRNAMQDTAASQKKLTDYQQKLHGLNLDQVSQRSCTRTETSMHVHTRQTHTHSQFAYDLIFIFLVGGPVQTEI